VTYQEADRCLGSVKQTTLNWPTILAFFKPEDSSSLVVCFMQEGSME
jgi:hypothetical protein